MYGEPGRLLSWSRSGKSNPSYRRSGEPPVWGTAHGTADDRLVGIDMVDRTARPAATQEHGEHAVVTAQAAPANMRQYISESS